jgi:heme d1 biosynthesis radical SAM protein NirJ
MLRISQYLREVALAERTGRYPVPPARRGGPAPGPVVIWNLTRRCNLTCKHCYAFSADHAYPGELTEAEMLAVLDDLKAYRVPALILSGGEPLLSPHLWTVARRAAALGFHTGLSTNGTLIDAALADRIATSGFDYVGISLDGLRATHDRFRRLEGAFNASLAALRLLRERAVHVGIRYTFTAMNQDDFPALLRLRREQDVPKFYFSHLNYAGRGNVHRARDAHFAATRAAMDLLFETAWQAAWDDEKSVEFVSGNNDADGVYLYRWVQARWPRWADALRQRLVAWGGNASGVAVANIDNRGHVHPDTMWWHHDLGSVRTRPFSQIWEDRSDPLMAGLKRRPRPLQGRCGLCPQRDICGGNTRVRAQQLSGNPWAEDPGCYLDDSELGLGAAGKTEVIDAPA